MRVASWIFGGMLIGVAVGVAAGLVRRRPTRFQRPSYAGGYEPPRPSSDHTAAPPPGAVDQPEITTEVTTGVISGVTSGVGGSIGDETGPGIGTGRGTERAPVR